MKHVAVGLDVSKGYADLLTLDSDAAVGALERIDDGPRGHDRFFSVLDEAIERYDTVAVGVESTGGLERCWKRCVFAWCKARSIQADRVSFHLLDPRIVKKTSESLGTRCKTDQSSARAIAECLQRQNGTSRTLPYDPDSEAMRGLLRAVCAVDQREAELVNQIKSLLPQVHPALVTRVANSGLPAWAIQLLKAYPTAERLARAHVKTVAKIPMITEAKAQALIREAQSHTMAAGGAVNAVHMTFLVTALQASAQHSEAQWDSIKASLKDSQEASIMESIPGVGSKTSAIMLAETGTLTRFVSADALIAFCGLDPVFEQSGDGITNKGISHKGPAKLRAMLFNAAKTAAVHNPIIKAFYHRLMARGKPYLVALTACMAKLLRIMYACVITGQKFDPAIHQKNLKANGEDHRAQGPIGRKEVSDPIQDPLAPISRKEKRRRENQKRQQEVDNKRGQSLNTELPAAAEKRALGRPQRKTAPAPIHA